MLIESPLWSELFLDSEVRIAETSVQFTLHCWLQSELNEHFDRSGWLNSSWPVILLSLQLCDCFQFVYEDAKIMSKKEIAKEKPKPMKELIIIEPVL